jgi:hypothetical protein
MPCILCASNHQAEFAAEMNIHFPGLKNLDKPSVWTFPKLLVCLDCGYSRFTIPETELALLVRNASANAAANGKESAGPARIVLREQG